ncbi:hypothetical protein [Aestuariivirga sp.]|uniref:hypothetical protein n=1 Tax=Aestuariivirga sp. TaxID=2650926 RepID=UPI0035932107
MSKLMWIAGILLIAAGIALGLMVFVSTASVVAWGIDLGVAAILLVGGLLNLGLGSVIDALQKQPLAMARVEAAYVQDTEVPPAPIPEFGRRNVETPPAAAAAATAAAAAVPLNEAVEISEPVKETIQALEKARQKIEHAFDPKPVPTVAAEPEPEPEPEPERETRPEPEAEVEAEAAPEPEEEATAIAAEIIEEEIVEEEVVEEGQLYVVEERFIRMRPARILSDGTVEAETDEGWMRFENLEHLDEYLDAMSPSKA